MTGVVVPPCVYDHSCRPLPLWVLIPLVVVLVALVAYIIWAIVVDGMWHRRRRR